MANFGSSFDTVVGLEVFPGQGTFNQEIDEELSRVDALTRYCYSPYWNQRLVFIQGITAVVRDSSMNEIRQQIVPLIGELLQDDVSEVKIAVLKQMPDIGQNLLARNGTNGCWEIEQLLPPVAGLVRNESVQVQQYALSALADIWAMVEQPKRIQLACLVVEDLAMDQHPNARIAASRLLAQMSSAMDESDIKLCACYALQLAQDEEAAVRQESVKCVVALGLFESQRADMISAFQKLCADDTWSVRQECAICLQQVATFHPDQQQVASTMTSLAKDNSKWARIAMLQNLLPVVAALAPQYRGEDWLEYFVSLMSMKVPAVQQELLEHSWAYQLPAAVQIAGRQIWPTVSPHYLQLAEKGSGKARHSIASSLPTLRSLLLEKQTSKQQNVFQGQKFQQILTNSEIQQQLIPIMEKLCQDEDQLVRIQAMFGATQWLEQMESEIDQTKYLEVLQQVVQRKEGQINCRDWRVSLVIAQQLKDILKIVNRKHPSTEELLKCFVQHPVAAVRIETQKQLAQL